MGSILGTGLFVSLALATQAADNGVLPAIVIAGLLALCNGLSSAQLASAHPVSGGTYEYGYRLLGPMWGFTAGWMFVIAKSASAATAALGVSGYLFHLLGVDTAGRFYMVTGLVILLLLTVIVSGGISRSNRTNATIVVVTLLGLAALVLSGWVSGGAPIRPFAEAFTGTTASSILYGSALMFVAYTGYGRIATLGEEVVEPRRTIPRAIITCMLLIIAIYLAVALTALQVMGADAFAGTLDGAAAPLVSVAMALELPVVELVVSVAAVTAMLGVMLNLVLGISRVMLGMARQRDMPSFMAHIKPQTRSPVAAVGVTGGVIALFVLSGDVALTWSFSAFTVLIYYAITNLAAIRLPAEQRLYPAAVPVAGLGGCLILAFWIDPYVWLSGLGIILAGLVWHGVARWLSGRWTNGWNQPE